MDIGMPMEDMLSAVAFRGDEGEVWREASAVVGRPVVLWEVAGARQAVARASSGPDIGAHPPGFHLDAILQRWSMRVPVGSRWVTAPGPTPEAWVVAPVRSRPPAPPPGGRERRSKERLALELAGLALGSIGAPTIGAGETTVPSSGMLLHHAANPLTAARAGLQLAMGSIGRWVDLAADRRLMLLDDLGEVLEDIDRTTELLRAVREHGTTRGAAPAGRPERFDAVRVIRSCLTLERRLLRDRGAAPATARGGAPHLSEQRLKVERPRVHPDAAVRATRPFVFRPIAVQLDAVAVGITEVDRLAHTVIRRAFQRNPVIEHSTHGSGKGGTVGKEDCEMIESCRSRRRARRASAGPRVQTDVMMVTARGDKHGVGSVPGGHFEA